MNDPQFRQCVAALSAFAIGFVVGFVVGWYLVHHD
jgi:hypothetical protein